MKKFSVSMEVLALFLAGCATTGPRVVFDPNDAFEQQGPAFFCYREKEELRCVDFNAFAAYMQRRQRAKPNAGDRILPNGSSEL